MWGVVDSTAWKKIICREQRKEDKQELHLDQTGKKSISLLPSYVITECQRWHEGVALRINHVPSASMTALVIVMSTKGCGDQTGAVMTSSKCHTHTHNTTNTRVSLGRHYLILGDRLMTGCNMTTCLMSKTVNDKMQFANYL